MRRRKNYRAPSGCRFYYPLDIKRLAAELQAKGIDIAPTRQTWNRVAIEIADAEGEHGREAFHKIVAVWPDYSSIDSERCFNRALMRADGTFQEMSYIKKACNKNGINTVKFTNHHIKRIVVKQPENKSKNIVMIDKNRFRKTQLEDRSLWGRSYLTDLLMKVFPQSAVLDAVEMYMVGFDSFITGRLQDSIVFWQINERYKVLNGKRITYQFNGHRDKRWPPMLLYRDNGQCLFGLHLLNEFPDKPIAIVESEKSALIMSFVDKDKLWMATGSLDNFNEKMLYPIKGRKIIAYPDLDRSYGKGINLSTTYVQWKNEALRLCKRGYNITVTDKLEKMAKSIHRLNKWDIADFALYSAIYKN